MVQSNYNRKKNDKHIQQKKKYDDRKKKIFKKYNSLIKIPTDISDDDKFRKDKINEFWGITTFFNPSHFKVKYTNYLKFRKSSKTQGLQLIAVELSYNNDFELQETDADVLIKIKGDKAKSIMWQKERLLNIALKNLPKNCKKVCWIDADIIFENSNWVYESSRLLDNYRMIHPYSKSYRLEKDQDPKTVSDNEKKKNTFQSIVFDYTMNGSYNSTKQTGYVWAIRRKIIDELGFYDKSIIGGGDRIIARGAFFKHVNHDKYRKNNLEFPYTQKHLKDIESYMAKFLKLVDRRVFFTKGLIHHMWHGDYLKRQYGDRHLILKRNKFDPEKDIKIGKSGCWEWKTDKTKMIASVSHYFKSRQEDE